MVGLEPERAGVIVGGALILQSAMAYAGLASTLVSEHDILYGMVLDPDCGRSAAVGRCIRIGTGGGLKSLWPQGRVGSNPTTATSTFGPRGSCTAG